MRRTIATAALVIAAMGLGRLITDHIPLEEVAAAPFVQRAAMEETVRLDYADLTVTAARVTPTIMGNPASAAGGRFLVVDLELVATTQPTTMAGFFLVDARGRQWIATDRGSECTTSVNLATGARTYLSVCFDVPKQALEGARLNATRGAWSSDESNFRRDDLADVDLGISTSEVDALWAQKEPVNVKQAGIVPPEEARR